MKTIIVAAALALGLSSCQFAVSREQKDFTLPGFVEADSDTLAHLHAPIDDLYVFNTFYDNADVDSIRMDLSGALIVLDDPKIHVASLDEINTGSLVETSDGWTVEEEASQCVASCNEAKARLLEMLRAKAKLTIDQTGRLVIRSPDGRWAIGDPLPTYLVD